MHVVLDERVGQAATYIKLFSGSRPMQGQEKHLLKKHGRGTVLALSLLNAELQETQSTHIKVPGKHKATSKSVHRRG